MIPARQVSEMLVALGLGLLGVVAVIFSLLFLVVQWAATTFTPRLLLFRDDPIVWRTFAFAIGQSVFDITAALAISNETDVSVVVPSLAVLALLATLTLIRLLQLRAFSAIQLAPVLASISSRGRAVVESVYPDTDRELPPLPTLPVIMTIEWHRPPAVLQQILVEDLLHKARGCHALVVFRVSPGSTLRGRLPLADVYGEPMPADAILDALVSGSERTFTQDPYSRFGYWPTSRSERSHPRSTILLRPSRLWTRSRTSSRAWPPYEQIRSGPSTSVVNCAWWFRCPVSRPSCVPDWTTS
ncbi:hypothetical protein GCM10020255_030330 [Rhodococcus baikonurensis]